MRHLSLFSVALVLGLTLALVTLFNYPVQAATTYYVDDDTCPDSGSGTEEDPFCSIQSGINVASTGDIVEVAAGTYEKITMKSGVVIQGAGQGISIIDGGASGSVVTANGVDSSAKLDGFTITNGNATYGGGMDSINSSPTVSNCTFSGNTASYYGGGMRIAFSSPTVTNCTFSGNTSVENGGGMYNWTSSPTVTNCTFSGNTSVENGGGMGNNNSSPNVINCTFSGNSADYGGGMYNDSSSSPTVTNCTFSENTAGIEGGGMHSHNYSSPTVTNCTFSGNSADYGGGMVHYDNSTPTVTNCTFSGNSAVLIGGGMYNGYQSSSTVTNCTFSGNTVGNYSGGGMYNDTYSSSTVTNCTFSQNTAGTNGGGMYNNFSSSPTVTNCVLWGGSPDELSSLSSAFSITYSDIQGGFEGTGNINADPMFVDPDGLDNVVGTEDDDLHLTTGSPCIDTGTSSGAPATDLEGNPRPQGAGYDMGAYESQLARTTAMPGILLLLGD